MKRFVLGILVEGSWSHVVVVELREVGGKGRGVEAHGGARWGVVDGGEKLDSLPSFLVFVLLCPPSPIGDSDVGARDPWFGGIGGRFMARERALARKEVGRGSEFDSVQTFAFFGDFVLDRRERGRQMWISSWSPRARREKLGRVGKR